MNNLLHGKTVCFMITVFSSLILGLQANFEDNFKINQDGVLEYISNQSCSSKEIILKFIKDQFDPYRENGISQEQVEDLYSLPPNTLDFLMIVRFQIIDQKLYATHVPKESWRYSRFSILANAIKKSLLQYPINNVDFIVFLSGGLHASPAELKNVPAFIFSQDLLNDNEKNLLLLPDAYLMGMWSQLYSKIITSRKKFPWKSKMNKFFFRGAPTGGHFTMENLYSKPRAILCFLSLNNPNIIDARFSTYINLSDEFCKNHLLKMFGPANRIPEVDHLKYKYLCSIDGHFAAWCRPVWIMLSNSILVKQISSFNQFFYPAMKPYIHYVPVKRDLSDIFDTFQWLREYDKEAEQISINAMKFVESCLMPDHLLEYIAKILNEYSKIQNFSPQKPTLPLYQSRAPETFEYSEETDLYDFCEFLM